MSEKSSKAKGARPLAQYAWLAAVAAVVAFAAVYVMLGRPDNDGRPAGKGAMTTFVLKKPPADLPDIRFVDGEGKETRLKDFAGKAVLLNLWATWCAPCREEMPALDRLQQELGSDRFQVVALAVDKAGLDGARKFFKENKIDALALYADPTARVGTELKAVGMPTTLLIDAQGREIGRLIGPAAWDSPDAKRLIEAFL
jgi:thiol-disulfide isomerase/thioredoxin